MRATGYLVTCALAFVATLAVMIGLRLPAEMRLIALGVLLGVAVCVPTSVVVSAAVSRALLSRHTQQQAALAAAKAALPPVEQQIFVLPTAAPEPAAPRPASPRAAPVSDQANAYTNDIPGARRFTIIGGTGKDDN